MARYRSNSYASWLWWAGALIAIAGGAAYRLMRLGPSFERSAALANLVLAATIVLSGICVICATAHWWFRR